MKEFVTGKIHTPKVEMEHKLVDGMKITDCEFMAKLKEAERQSGTPGEGTKIRVEKKGLIDLPLWLTDY